MSDKVKYMLHGTLTNCITNDKETIVGFRDLLKGRIYVRLKEDGARFNDKTGRHFRISYVRHPDLATPFVDIAEVPHPLADHAVICFLEDFIFMMGDRAHEQPPEGHASWTEILAEMKSGSQTGQTYMGMIRDRLHRQVGTNQEVLA